MQARNMTLPDETRTLKASGLTKHEDEKESNDVMIGAQILNIAQDHNIKEHIATVYLYKEERSKDSAYQEKYAWTKTNEIIWLLETYREIFPGTEKGLFNQPATLSKPKKPVHSEPFHICINREEVVGIEIS